MLNTTGESHAIFNPNDEIERISDSLFRDRYERVDSEIKLVTPAPYGKESLTSSIVSYLERETGKNKVVKMFLREFDIKDDRGMVNTRSNSFKKVLGKLTHAIQQRGHSISKTDHLEEVEQSHKQNNDQLVALDNSQEEKRKEKDTSKMKELKRENNDKTNSVFGASRNTERQITNDINKNLDKVIDDTIIHFMQENIHISQSNKDKTSVQGSSDSDKEKRIRTYEGRIEKIRKLNRRDISLKNISDVFEGELNGLSGAEKARKVGGTFAKRAGDILLSAGVATSLDKYDPTGYFDAGIDMGHKLMGNIDQAIGIDITQIVNSLGSQLSSIQESINSVGGNMTTIIGLVTFAGFAKALSTRLKNNQLTLSLKEKEEIKIIIDRWSIVLGTISISPLLVGFGFDKLPSAVQDTMNYLSTLL